MIKSEIRILTMSKLIHMIPSVVRYRDTTRLRPQTEYVRAMKESILPSVQSIYHSQSIKKHDNILIRTYDSSTSHDTQRTDEFVPRITAVGNSVEDVENDRFADLGYTIGS